MRLQSFRLACLAASVVGVLAFAAPAAADTPPATLTDENLSAGELGDPGTSRVSGTCNPAGRSTFHFAVTGEAHGPYEGTFSEVGSFMLGPVVEDELGNRVQKPLAFYSAFVIRAGASRVAGVKTLIADGTEFGACGPELADPGHATANAFILQFNTRYEALAAIRGGVLRDRGVAFTDYGDLGVRGIPDFQSWRFLEIFTSELP